MKINIIEYATLIMHLKLHGLDEKKSIEYEYISAPLTNLDKFTLSYLSAHEFFKQEKEKVLNELSKEKVMEKYDIKIAPVDIEMEKVFIKTDEKNLWALFQNILYKEEMINLENLIKQMMLNGTLYNVYLCDKIRQQNPEYESIFNGCDEPWLFAIEVALDNESIIEKVWNSLKKQKRFYSIIRFLLVLEPLSTMEEKFNKTVPLVDNPYKKAEEQNKRSRNIMPEIRTPYKEE